MSIMGYGKPGGPFLVPAYISSPNLDSVGNVMFAIDSGTSRSTLSSGTAKVLGINYGKLGTGTNYIAVGGLVKIHNLADVTLVFKTGNARKPFHIIKLKEIGVIGPSGRDELPNLLGLDVISNFSIQFNKDSVKLTSPGVIELTTRKALARLDRNQFNKTHSYLEHKNEFVRELCIYIDNVLRTFVRTTPSSEIEIQDELEKMLVARNYGFEREGPTVHFSVKHVRPDFTFVSHNSALEVKLCKTNQRLKDIVDEIAADIMAYKKQFGHLIFIVYDLGIIKNVVKFTQDLESSGADVVVLVVKE